MIESSIGGWEMLLPGKKEINFSTARLVRASPIHGDVETAAFCKTKIRSANGELVLTEDDEKRILALKARGRRAQKRSPVTDERQLKISRYVNDHPEGVGVVQIMKALNLTNRKSTIGADVRWLASRGSVRLGESQRPAFGRPSRLIYPGGKI